MRKSPGGADRVNRAYERINEEAALRAGRRCLRPNLHGARLGRVRRSWPWRE